MSTAQDRIRSLENERQELDKKRSESEGYIFLPAALSFWPMLFAFYWFSPHTVLSVVAILGCWIGGIALSGLVYEAYNAPANREIKRINLEMLTVRKAALNRGERLDDLDINWNKLLSFGCSPFFFLHPIAAFTTHFSISGGEIRVDRSFFGIKYGSRPSMKVENCTRVHATGTIIGSIVFGEGSAEPVTWRGLWRPDAKLKKIKPGIDALT